LKQIEVTFKGVLFRRSKSGISPTAEGKLAIDHARVLCNEIVVMASSILSSRLGHDRPLRLGSLTITSIVPKAIAALRNEYPDAMVHIHEGGVDVLIEALLMNK